MQDVNVSPVSKLADEMEKQHWLAEDTGRMPDGDPSIFSDAADPVMQRLCLPIPQFQEVARHSHNDHGLLGGPQAPESLSVVRHPLQTADSNALASRYNSTPSSNGTPQLMQDASPSPTPYICRRRSSSSSHKRRRKLQGPSASADFDLNKENRMQDWLCPTSNIQQATKAKRKLYCGHSPPATAGRRGPAKRQCPMYQSMPGPLRFDGFGGPGGPLGRPTSQLNPLLEGASVHRSVSHLDTSTMHMAGGGECGHPNPNRSSMSHKPPLSPHYSSAQPLVDSFSANFITFGADRVQSSPCIMQTDHAESHENNRPSHELMQEEEARTKCLVGSSQRPAGTDTFVLQGNTKIGASDSLRAEPCDLWSVNQMNDCAVLDAKACYSAAQEAVSPMLEELGSTSLKPQSGIQSSTVGNGGPQQAAGMQLCCDRFDNPGLQGRLGSGQALADDDHMACCSNSAYAVEVAAAAASLSGLPAASSPCCTFLLPTALSQGISASPAPSGDSGSDGSARRKSFSPLESGPVSILPLVENALIGLPSVSCSTLAKLIAGQHDRPSIDVKIVDCRYPYEYAGGHIPGSTNIASPDDGVALTFGSDMTLQGQSTAIILYCEFSSERAPRLFRYLRNMDRRNHLADYPKLTFPHMYVLKGGYQTFHEQFPAMCNPQHAYVRMHDAAHLEDHKACRKMVKAAWDLKAACSRNFM